MTIKKQAETVRKCMIKQLLIAILAITPLFSHAKSYIIEIADFKCKFCLEAEPHTAILKNETKWNNDKFIFAPIDNGMQTQKDLIDEAFYFGIRDTHPKAETIKEILFDMNQKLQLKMGTYEELIDWIAIYTNDPTITKESLETAFTKGSSNYEHIISIKKTISLINKHNIKSTPSFILISNTGVERVIIRPPETTIGEYINITLDAYKRMKESEK